MFYTQRSTHKRNASYPAIELHRWPDTFIFFTLFFALVKNGEIKLYRYINTHKIKWKAKVKQV